MNQFLTPGCGEGFGLDLLRRKKIGKNWRGIDFSAEAIRVGQGLFSDLTLEKGSIYQIPVADKSYDLVLCCEVLEHLERPRAALKELLRIARGDIFLSVPNEPWFQLANLLRGKYIRDLGNHPEHINHWSVNEFEKLLVAENLTIELTETPFPWIQVLLRT